MIGLSVHLFADKQCLKDDVGSSCQQEMWEMLTLFSDHDEMRRSKQSQKP